MQPVHQFLVNRLFLHEPLPDEIARLTPSISRERFVFSIDRAAYEREFGSSYRRPGLFSRFLGFLYRLLPKIGPLKPLSFKAPTPIAEKLFLESFQATRQRYGDALNALASGRLELQNMNFDIGKPTRRGEYRLADQTYARLLERLADGKGRTIPNAMRRDLHAFFSVPLANPTRSQRKCEQKVRKRLDRLDAVATDANR